MIYKSSLPTQFAPAERLGAEEIRSQGLKFSGLTILNRFLNAIPDIFVVLNKQRQIVYANKTILDFLGLESDKFVIGKRVGEALNCTHAYETDGGCGTTEFCKNCGAVNAILNSQKGKPDIQECRITLKDKGDALDLRVWATPFQLAGDDYTIFAVADISDEKRRRALERIFFHDILNTAGGIFGFAEALKQASIEEWDEFREIIYNLSAELIEEIKAQRELIAAENNELSVNLSTFKTLPILFDIKDLFANHEVARNKSIEIEEAAENIPLESDKVLLRRVLSNMLKNALEASSENHKIVLGCKLINGYVEFYVANPNQMPRDIQLQIFQRSFSTKGAGRGLGTYSMKLLTERYLKGNVYFTSDEDGTTFFAKIPVKFPQLTQD